jgi:hypothetical protein
MTPEVMVTRYVTLNFGGAANASEQPFTTHLNQGKN